MAIHNILTSPAHTTQILNKQDRIYIPIVNSPLHKEHYSYWVLFILWRWSNINKGEGGGIPSFMLKQPIVE